MPRSLNGAPTWKTTITRTTIIGKGIKKETDLSQVSKVIFPLKTDQLNNCFLPELPESDRYTHLERDEAYFSKSSAELDRVGEMKFVKNNQKLNKSVAGYRHSYAEPKLKGDKIGSKKPFAEMLHRTNSTVSNSGRVGIASVHPY